MRSQIMEDQQKCHQGVGDPSLLVYYPQLYINKLVYVQQQCISNYIQGPYPECMSPCASMYVCHQFDCNFLNLVEKYIINQLQGKNEEKNIKLIIRNQLINNKSIS
ncbi:hypothetical protein TTHERM_000586763 (macronuclear) [Tetrahymena thermophila SB210]|uniref:Uncharacterized protein n=1 Tax=Tetrahymena thermophila (strain SB210) TaxID=312017 RepID=W7XGT9_TETTS|nr:hypothetical protein TTHERM_000586763 [Tetrahymena thermophila SB210]EWS73441.1 hypothetical protein TTHERM_000586763 [Tetrahymena thermophila SB210]|eukprot:XP_012654012.1 hypothetical protein TTHERM_000586763 [Tetrahymena thermophila SB210]